jgi:hypothetical protein
MRWKTGDIIIGVITPEFIQKKKRIQHIEFRRANDAGQAHTSPIAGLDALYNFFYFTKIHPENYDKEL